MKIKFLFYVYLLDGNYHYMGTQSCTRIFRTKIWKAMKQLANKYPRQILHYGAHSIGSDITESEAASAPITPFGELEHILREWSS
jgi:hypothetical protein